MENFHSGSANNITATRLEKLAQLYKQQQASDLMTRTLNKLLHYEAEISQEQLARLLDDLADFEQQHNLSSQEFFRRFQVGEMDDRMDFVEWAALFQMAENLQARLRLLTGEE